MKNIGVAAIISMQSPLTPANETVSEKKKIVFIILGVVAIGFSMNAYAMMGGGRTQSRQYQHIDNGQQGH